MDQTILLPSFPRIPITNRHNSAKETPFSIDWVTINQYVFHNRPLSVLDDFVAIERLQLHRPPRINIHVPQSGPRAAGVVVDIARVAWDLDDGGHNVVMVVVAEDDDNCDDVDDDSALVTKCALVVKNHVHTHSFPHFL